MQIKIDVSELKNKLDKCGYSIESSVPHAILHGLKIVPQDNKLILSTTNLELICITSIGAEIENGVDILVPFKLFSSIINKLKKGKCSLEVKENKLLIKQNKIKFNLDLMDIEEYPKFDEVEWNNIGKVNTKKLKNIIFSAEDSISSGNPIIYSIFFDKDRLVATDTIRVSATKIDKLKESFILPYSTSDILRNLSTEFKVFLSGNRVRFTNKDVNIISKLIDGEYIDYKQFVKKNKYSIQMPKEELIEIIERSNISDNESIYFDITKDTLKVKNSSEVLQYEEEVKTNFSGKELQLRFNPKYLLDILNVLSYKEVKIEVEDSETPILIKSKDQVHIFLPMEV